jgi:hypothetical protein
MSFDAFVKAVNLIYAVRREAGPREGKSMGIAKNVSSASLYVTGSVDGPSLESGVLDGPATGNE